MKNFDRVTIILITYKTGILYHYNNTVIIFAFLLGLVIAFEYFETVFRIS